MSGGRQLRQLAGELAALLEAGCCAQQKSGWSRLLLLAVGALERCARSFRFKRRQQGTGLSLGERSCPASPWWLAAQEEEEELNAGTACRQ